MTAAFFLQHLLEKRVYPRLVWLAAIPALLVMVVLSGSRSAAGIIALILAAVFVVCVVQARYRVSSLKLAALVAGMALLAGSFAVARQGMDVFSSRFQSNKVEEHGFTGRYLQTWMLPFTVMDRAQAGGAGLGMGTNVAAGLATGKRTFMFSEGEGGRIVLESGPVVGLAYILLRLAITVYLGFMAWRALREHAATLPLLLFSGCFNDVLLGQFSQPTELGFATIAGGLCLTASLRAGEPSAEEEAEAAGAAEAEPENAALPVGRKGGAARSVSAVVPVQVPMQVPMQVPVPVEAPGAGAGGGGAAVESVAEREGDAARTDREGDAASADREGDAARTGDADRAGGAGEVGLRGAVARGARRGTAAGIIVSRWRTGLPARKIRRLHRRVTARRSSLSTHDRAGHGCRSTTGQEVAVPRGGDGSAAEAECLYGNAMSTEQNEVLIVGNYLPDGQESMQRFARMLAEGLRAEGVSVESIVPVTWLGKLKAGSTGVGKWLAYVDKYLIFPWVLRRRVRGLAAGGVVHVADHSNAVYVPAARSSGHPVLVTCHDLGAVRGALGEDTDCPASRMGKVLQAWIARSLGAADGIACVSTATREDVARLIRRKDGSRVPTWLVLNGLNVAYRRWEVGSVEWREAGRIVSRKVRQVAEAENGQGKVTRESGVEEGSDPFVLNVGSSLSRKNRGRSRADFCAGEGPLAGGTAGLCRGGFDAGGEGVGAEARRDGAGRGGREADGRGAGGAVQPCDVFAVSVEVRGVRVARRGGAGLRVPGALQRRGFAGRGRGGERVRAARGGRGGVCRGGAETGEGRRGAGALDKTGSAKCGAVRGRGDGGAVPGDLRGVAGGGADGGNGGGGTMRTLLMAVSLLLPWALRRWWLGKFFGYEIHPTARIGRSWVMPGRLVMEAGARIGSGTVCKGLELVEMGEGAHLGNLNWVTGLPRGGSRYFLHQPERRPELRMGRQASVTNRHLIDCTGAVSIGAFATPGGVSVADFDALD